MSYCCCFSANITLLFIIQYMFNTAQNTCSASLFYSLHLWILHGTFFCYVGLIFFALPSFPILPKCFCTITGILHRYCTYFSEYIHIYTHLYIHTHTYKYVYLRLYIFLVNIIYFSFLFLPVVLLLHTFIA